MFYGKHFYIDNLPEGNDLSYNGEVQTFSLNGVYFVGTEFYGGKPAFTGKIGYDGGAEAWKYNEVYYNGSRWQFQTQTEGATYGDRTIIRSEGGEDYPWEVTKWYWIEHNTELDQKPRFWPGMLFNDNVLNSDYLLSLYNELCLECTITGLNGTTITDANGVDLTSGNLNDFDGKYIFQTTPQMNQYSASVYFTKETSTDIGDNKDGIYRLEWTERGDDAWAFNNWIIKHNDKVILCSKSPKPYPWMIPSEEWFIPLDDFDSDPHHVYSSTNDGLKYLAPGVLTFTPKYLNQHIENRLFNKIEYLNKNNTSALWPNNTLDSSSAILQSIVNNPTNLWDSNNYQVIAGDSNKHTILNHYELNNVNRYYNTLKIGLSEPTTINNMQFTFYNKAENLTDGFNMFITGGNGIVQGKFSNLSIHDYNSKKQISAPNNAPVDNKYISIPYTFNVNTNNVNKFRIYWSNNNINKQNLNLTEIVINDINNPLTTDTSNSVIKKIVNYVNSMDRNNFYENLNNNNFDYFLYNNQKDIETNQTLLINLYKLARDNASYTDLYEDNNEEYFYLDVELVNYMNIETIKLYFIGHSDILSAGANVWISTNGYSSIIFDQVNTGIFETANYMINIDNNEIDKYVDDISYVKASSELDIENYIATHTEYGSAHTKLLDIENHVGYREFKLETLYEISNIEIPLYTVAENCKTVRIYWQANNITNNNKYAQIRAISINDGDNSYNHINTITSYSNGRNSVSNYDALKSADYGTDENLTYQITSNATQDHHYYRKYVDGKFYKYMYLDLDLSNVMNVSKITITTHNFNNYYSDKSYYWVTTDSSRYKEHEFTLNTQETNVINVYWRNLVKENPPDLTTGSTFTPPPKVFTIGDYEYYLRVVENTKSSFQEWIDDAASFNGGWQLASIHKRRTISYLDCNLG